jgi:hypothetical protein
MLDPCPDSLSHLVSKQSHRRKMHRKDITCLWKTTGRTVPTRKSLLFRAHEPGFASEPCDSAYQKKMTMKPSIELDISILLTTSRSSNSCVTPAECSVTPYIFVNELTFQARDCYRKNISKYSQTTSYIRYSSDGQFY